MQTQDKPKPFTKNEIVTIVESLLPSMVKLDIDERIDCINLLREKIHAASPFYNEPVDLVQWVKCDSVEANDYNPNTVAPPEMELLRHSVMVDGYTQPIVTNPENEKFIVVDGFHRNRVGKECSDVKKRVLGYLPVVKIKADRTDRNDRIAATIRHNRARGKHKVEAMSDIVVELKRRNWSDERIGRELGMDPDEVLRLCQITGLAEVFKDQQFSEAWEVQNVSGGKVFGELINDVISDYEPDDGNRIYHTWDKWECYKAGFFAERPPGGLTQEQGEEVYKEFLSDSERFKDAMTHVINEWKYSCEHNLTNDRMNRIAWMGQSSACYATGMPATCRGGFHSLSKEQQDIADGLALEYLNKWLVLNGREAVTMEIARGRTEAELY